MSAPDGGYYESQAFLSPSRANRKSITILTGGQIATLSPTYAGQIVICTATGGPSNRFIINTPYMRNSDNTDWIGLAGGKHLHNTDSESSGGLLSDIMVANQPLILNISEH